MRKKSRLRRLAKILGVLLAIGLLGDVLLVWLTYGERGLIQPGGEGRLGGTTLSITSLNLAHGRAEGPNQLFQSEAGIRENLRAVEALLEESRAEVVCFQEADRPSFWSGGFDHVELLRTELGYAESVHADNVKGLGLSYGTAILSDFEVQEAHEYTFARTFPTFSKGFAVATVGTAVGPVDVVSVHLDFASSARRASQLEEMAGVLAPRTNALIVAGDFNCGWDDAEDLLPKFCDRLGLQAYEPASESLATYPRFESRIDWILIDEAFRFESYGVHTNRVSDHRAISARISLEGE